MKVLIMLLFVVTLFLCFFGSVFVQGSPVHHSVVAVPSHAPQFVTSVLDNTETNENATASFTYNSSPEIVIAVTVSLDAGNVIYAAEYTHRLIFSTCSAETLYDTFLTLVNAQPGDDLTSVDLSNPDVYMASDGDYNCQTDPMGIKAASIVYDSSSLGADALLYVIIEGYDDAVGQFNLSVINCGTSCLEYDLSPTCSCAVCADGFALQEDGSCVLVDCVDYASNAPACTCDEDYTNAFSWNVTTTTWDGMCVADCSNAPDCGGLQREECLLTAHACSECLPGFVANGTDQNEECIACADENCLSCTDAEAGSCLECSVEVELVNGICDNACYRSNTWVSIQSLQPEEGVTSVENFGPIATNNMGWLLVGAYRDNAGGYDAGAVYFYYFNVSTDADASYFSYAQTQKELGPLIDGRFGLTVAVNDNNAAVITADHGASGLGYAYIYQLNTDTWLWEQTAELQPDLSSDGDRFGYIGTAINNNNIALVGAYKDDDGAFNSGAVYVFREVSEQTWEQIEKLYSTPASNAYFGYGVEINDDNIIVAGAPVDDSNGFDSGQIFIFHEVSENSFSQVASMTSLQTSAEEMLGRAISLDMPVLFVGAEYLTHSGAANAGCVYIFEYGDDWTQTQKLIPSDFAAEDLFGQTLFVKNGIGVIGSKTKVYIFLLRSDGIWFEQDIITPPETIGMDGWGGVSLVQGKYAVVGSRTGGTGTGIVNIFQYDCTPPVFTECPSSQVVVSVTDVVFDIVNVEAIDSLDPTPTVICSHSINSSVSLDPGTSTTVFCNATDDANNVAESHCIYNLTVIYPNGTLYFTSCATSRDFSASLTLLSETSLNLEHEKLSGEDIVIQYTVLEASDFSVDLVHVEMSYVNVDYESQECPNGDIAVETHGDCSWEYISNDTWLVCPPSIEPNTLRKVTETSGTSTLLGLNVDGGSIAFDGKHLYPAVTDHTIVNVWYGDFTTGNVTACENVVSTGTSISCVIPPLDEDWYIVQNLHFQVNVTSLISGITLSSQISSDVYHYPVAPTIISVNGCGSTKNASGCRTVGGDVVTITGSDLALATDVTVDGLDCDIQDHIDDNTLTCTLPANDGANRAVIAYQNSVASEPVFVVSYAVPNVLSVSGCPSNTESSTFNCPDEPVDGQVTTLTITGTDFGSDVSAVFIGTQQALSVETHNDSIIYCTLPKGGGEDNSIMIVQQNGQVAVAQNSFVSYKPCPGGTYLNGAECDPCDKGYYTNDKTIKTQCVACNLGEYQDETGQTDCKDCDAGRFSEQLATNYSCTDCPIGKFSLQGASECRGCSADTQYAPEKGMDGCINCPTRAVRRSDDVSQCYCDTLFYWDTSQNDENNTELICEPCDTRWYNCSQPGYTLETLILMPGYWRSSSSIYEPEECFSPEMCPGGAFDASLTEEGNEELCGFPRTGPMCAQCVKGYIADALTSPCEECMDSSLQLLFFIVAGFVALMFCGYYVHKTLKKADKEKGEISTLGKIMVSAFQINSIAISFAFVWEGAFNDFIAAESAASSLGTSALNFSCLTANDGDGGLKAVYIETLLYLLSGFFVSVVPNLFLVPYLYFTSARVDVLVDVKENLINIYRVALPIVFFLLHPTLTQRTMNLFHCTDINGTLYLTQQLDEECWEGDHLAWVFSAGILMIVFYVLGLPLAAVYFLYKNQDKIHADHPEHATFHKNYSFLYKGYAVDIIGKDHYAWGWEAVVTARKVFLMFILVFFANDAHLQSLLGLLGMMIALSTHAYAMPFESSLLNAAEFISLLCSFITFYLGQFTYVQDTDPDVRLTASWMALIVNVGFLLVMLGFMIYSAKEKRDAKKEVERIRAQSEAAGDRLEDDDIKNFGDKGSDRRRKATLEFRQLRHERANSQQQFRIRGFTTDLKDIEMTTITEEKSVVHDDVAMSVDELKQDHEPEPVLDTPPALPTSAPVEVAPLP